MNLNTKNIINYLLLPLSGVFFILSKIRQILYQIGIFKVNQFDVPVLVVGNITMGGSGKTPVVIKLAQHFQKQGRKVGVVSRGYGGSHTTGSLLVAPDIKPFLSGDEPLLIALHTKATVMVNKNRTQAVLDLINQYQVDIIISDDGLQHYAMGRKIEIAVIDGNRRFGNGFLLPAGVLRELPSRLKTVDFVINNGATYSGEITAKLTPVVFVHILTGNELPLDYFNQQHCHGVAGIGYPERFFNTLKQLNIEVEKHAFIDHYAYQADDLIFDDNYPIIMSAKDWVKCREFANDKMYYLKVDLNISKDFLNQLDAKI